jgi:cyclic-di-AMP phosphodiesterase PgpH
MASTDSDNRQAYPLLVDAEPSTWKADLRTALLLLLFVAVSSIVLLVQISPVNDLEALDVGDVTPYNVLAPKRVTYVSDVETEAARDRAEAAVPPTYDLPDARIARQQIARARQILDYFDSVRADNYATIEAKKELVAAVNDLVLTDDIISRLLTTNNDTWSIIKSETIAVLDQAMRAEIRTSQLSSTRRRLPTLIGLDVSDEAATVVIAIVEDLIKPNTFVNETRTAEEQQLARESVQPSTVTIERNESILRAGDVVRPGDIEALEALGLRHTSAQSLDTVITVAFMAFIGLLMGLYIWRFKPHILRQGRYVWLVFSLLVIYVIMIRLMVPGHTLLPYLVPTAALSITFAALIDANFGILVTMLMGLAYGYVGDGSLELTVYAAIGGLIGIFGLGRIERVSRLLWTGVYVALTNALVVMLFNVANTDIDSMGILQLGAAAIGNGALSASLTFFVFFVVGYALGITTSLQLSELARPTQPLLRQLLLRAPGTYHHSLMVSNLAEQAAEQIGANNLLTRVGAYYHDVGKMLRPYFFVENQVPGHNIQDRLDPYTSTRIIISHVTDGLMLAKKYRLPRDIAAFIAEHQGTGVIKYFYHEALEQAEDPETIDKDDFRYPGPKPQSKETAIVMLADSCEAAVRAAVPDSTTDIDKIIRNVFVDKITSGELDECDLNMRDLAEIRDAFVQMLKGTFHPRIRYPEEVQEQLALKGPDGGDTVISLQGQSEDVESTERIGK